MTDTGEPTSARTAYLLNATVAWFGLLMTTFLSGMGWYDETVVEPGLYGGHPPGAAGAGARLLDTFSYFTIWSNLVVALSLTLLVARPRPTQLSRTLRLAGLVMITVTAILNQLLLAPSAVVTGWSRLTDPILHVVTPLTTLVVWALWGPRGWISRRTVPWAIAIPLLWIGWMLARGAVIDAYPYDFLNVDEFGYASVLTTLGVILVFGLLVAAAFWGIERLLAARATRPARR